MPSGITRTGNAASAESPPPEKGGRKPGALRFRVLSAVLFLPPFVFITKVGDLPFFLLVLAIALLATVESYRLFRSRGVSPLLPFGLLAAVALLVILREGRADRAFFFLVLFFLIALLSLLPRKGPAPFSRVAGAMFILVYAAGLPGFLVLLRELPRTALSSYGYGEGASFVYLLFLTAWGCDTGAYTVGRLFGRRKLAPSISPKKTVEGAVGGLLFAVAGAVAARAFLVEGLSLADAAFLGVGAGVLGQAGDLVESALKREADVKDSARLIPGHGGVLDRFDSLFLAAPFVYGYLRFALGGGS
ncbi:MAG: phosphatidate cytidylyltransferase [Candidatus Eisenbacteria bacterium]